MSRRVLLCIMLLGLGVGAEGQFFRTLGLDIIDPQGQKFILKGYGLGGWLVPEGYMLHMPGFGSPSSIRRQISELIGESRTNQFFDSYRKNYVAEQDIRLIAEWGFNSIRLPFHYQFFSPIDSPGVYIEDGFRIIDTLLVWCKRYNLYLILDMHCAPGGQNHGNISDADGEAKLWTQPANQERTIAIWRRIAEYYADEPWIVGYDLLNEPVLPTGYSNATLRDFFVRLRDAVREVDANHILFIEGNWYATDFNQLAPRFDNNMVWAFHKYWNATDLASIQSYRNLRTQTVTPLWLGETGENSNPWYYEVVALMEQQSIGWNWWAHKKFNTTTSPLSAIMPAGFQQLIDYWNGNASKPTADFAYNALMSAAANLSAERCEYRPDVIAALTDPEFGTRPKPVKVHIVPGTIMASDYDFGTNGIAYSDVDYKNTRSEDPHWNRGYQLRNDGVDLESCTAGGYNIGYIEDNEWVRYTVEIVYTGQYHVDFLVASNVSTGRLQLQLDGQVLVNDLPVINTGGWQNWQNVRAENVFLPKGTHTLEVHFNKGSFNLHKITFTSGDSAIIEQVSTDLYIGHNYPNPFNDQTIIPVILLKSAHLRLNIFDLQGKLVRNLFSGALPRGLNELVWDGTDNASHRVGAGIYYYQLAVDSLNYRAKAMLHLK